MTNHTRSNVLRISFIHYPLPQSDRSYSLGYLGYHKMREEKTHIERNKGKFQSPNSILSTQKMLGVRYLKIQSRARVRLGRIEEEHEEGEVVRL